MLSSTAQLDYNLVGYTFDCLAVPNAVMHITSTAFNDQTYATVNASIFDSMTGMQNGNAPLEIEQWGYTITDGQTMAQVYASLLTHPNAGPILVGSTPVVGE